jgi:hypothetical protein
LNNSCGSLVSRGRSHGQVENVLEFVLAIRSRDRGEREAYERIVELYVRIAEEIEALIHG